MSDDSPVQDFFGGRTHEEKLARSKASWEHLGASWERLGRLSERLGASWEALGASWRLLERLRSVLRGS